MSNLFINKQILQGSILLICKQALVQVTGIFCGIYLVKHISPNQFGHYALYSFFFYFFLSIGDLGVGASSMKHSIEPSAEKYTSIFCLQFIIGISFLIISYFSILVGVSYFNWIPEESYPFLLIPIASTLFSMQIVPTIKLERNLKFSSIALTEILQTFLYAYSLIYLISNSYGLYSFGLAYIAFSTTGAIFTYFIQPWDIKLRMDKSFIQENLKFGLPFQMSIAINHLRNSALPVIVGSLLGMEAVGKLNFAQMLVLSCSMGLLVLQRVYYPAFLRINQRGSKGETTESLSYYLFFANVLAAPPSVFIIYFSDTITKNIFGVVWLDALIFAKGLWFINLMLPSIGVLISFVQSQGRSALVLKVTLISIAVSWAVGALLIDYFQEHGYVAAMIISNLILLTLLLSIREFLNIRSLLLASIPWLVSLGLISAVGQFYKQTQDNTLASFSSAETYSK